MGTKNPNKNPNGTELKINFENISKNNHEITFEHNGNNEINNKHKHQIYIGHRGFRKIVPENTITAFKKGAKIGLDYIEMDIHLSKDNVAYVIHDKKLNRTINGKGLITKTKSERLDGMLNKEENKPILRWDFLLKTFNSDPIFIEAFNRQQPLKLMVELKEYNKKVADIVIRDLEKIAPNLKSLICFSAHSLKPLKAAHKKLPTAELCWNITSARDFSLKKFMKINNKEQLPLPFQMISLRSTSIEKDFINQCHRFGIKALAWDFIKASNFKILISRLIEMGIDGILLDEPMDILE